MPWLCWVVFRASSQRNWKRNTSSCLHYLKKQMTDSNYCCFPYNFLTLTGVVNRMRVFLGQPGESSGLTVFMVERNLIR